ncbi:hypothetical protein T439DRAFT_354943 [Meredithblackwellia eburnea MCA 4105]
MPRRDTRTGRVRKGPYYDKFRCPVKGCLYPPKKENGKLEVPTWRMSNLLTHLIAYHEMDGGQADKWKAEKSTYPELDPENEAHQVVFGHFIKGLACSRCGQVFMRRHKLVDHEAAPHEGDVFECPFFEECGKEQKHKKHLKAHMGKQHDRYWQRDHNDRVIYDGSKPVVNQSLIRDDLLNVKPGPSRTSTSTAGGPLEELASAFMDLVLSDISPPSPNGVTCLSRVSQSLGLTIHL